MLDLEPATASAAALVHQVRDDQLTGPTPCADMTLGDLLDHLDGLSMAFTAAATKTRLGDGRQGPSADASRLGTDWRARIAERLARLAEAWRDEAAWAGVTRAGGIDLPEGTSPLPAARPSAVSRRWLRRRTASSGRQRRRTHKAAQGCSGRRCQWRTRRRWLIG